MSAVGAGGLASAPAGTEVLTPFVRAGVLGRLEVHCVAAIGRLAGGLGPEEQLALAAAVRATRLGHVGLELEAVHRLAADADDELASTLDWPETGQWAAVLEDSRIVAQPADYEAQPLRPLVWDGRRLYLQRYFDFERCTAAVIAARCSTTPVLGEASPAELDSCLDAVFGPRPSGRDRQREAARRALTEAVSVIAGGPGTGKTHTVARALSAAHLVASRRGEGLRVALAAPTGKAASRMLEAVRQQVAALEGAGAITPGMAARIDSTPALTVHRLLGAGGGTRFRHGRRNPLAYDMVVVDETSMLSLPLLSRLLEALPPAAHLVLVGDPFQLTSIEVGTVMADLVGPDPLSGTGPLAGHVSVLDHVHRFAADSAVAALARAVRTGDAARAMAVLDGESPDVSWVRSDDAAALAEVERVAVDGAVDVATRAIAGDAAGALAAATGVKVLAARRLGRLSAADWSERIEAAVAERVPAFSRYRRWAPGRPVIVTANDALNGLSNGDVGVVVTDGDSVAVAMAGPSGIDLRSTAQLAEFEWWWAMTIHKAQGSEFGHAVVSLADAASPVLSRELLYTAVTRAPRITVVSSEAALRTAIERPVARASGLGELLWP